jgi:branched-chain amino acid transport system permease protein
MILQMIINGLLVGGLYASIGVSFSLVYGIMGIINLAQGTQIILGAYLTCATCQLFHIDPFLTLPVSALVLFGMGYAVQRCIINLVGKGGVVLTSLLTFGLNLVLINIILLVWNADFRGVNPSYAGKNFEVAGVTIPYVRLAVFFVAVVATMTLHWFLGHTQTGNAIHASSQNKRAAQIVGINIRHSYALTFAISSGLAGAMGTLYVILKPVSPFSGADLLMILFLVAVLGGLGNIPGALLGGMVMGLADSFSVLCLGMQYQKIVLFLGFILVLIFLPRGFFGRRFYG